MSEYNNRSKRPKTIETPVGAKEKIIYGIEYEDDGSKKVIVKGLENIYDKAQEGRELFDINNIVKRYTNGDPFALNKVKTEYGDFIDTPKDIVTAMQVINNAKEAFDRLPNNIREAYGYDPEKFLADAGSEKFKELMKITEDIKTEPAEEVKTDNG